MTHRDVQSLFRDAKEGNPQAFEEIYKAYAKPLYRYIYLRTQSKEVSEDLLQEVFIQIYKQIGTMRVDERGPLPFFFTIARNKVIDYWRTKKDTVPLDEEIMHGELEEPVLDDRVEKATDVFLLLQTLPPLYRDVLSFSFIQELSTAQIADILHKTPDNIRKIKSRALQVLRNIYEA